MPPWPPGPDAPDAARLPEKKPFTPAETFDYGHGGDKDKKGRLMFNSDRSDIVFEFIHTHLQYRVYIDFLLLTACNAGLNTLHLHAIH